MEKLFSAAEIADLDLPGVPKTRAGVRSFAERENWYYEERSGVGGMRRVYRVPASYLRGAEAKIESVGVPPKAPVIAAVAAGTKADRQKLAIAVQALEEWASEQGISIDPERKGAIISVLYDYIVKGATDDDVANLLTVMRG